MYIVGQSDRWYNIVIILKGGIIVDLVDFEEIISKIQGIINVKIVSEGENIIEVHVLSNKIRAPKQIVRDIESSLMATFGYKIDRKVISVAQIEINQCKTFKKIQLEGISMATSGSFIECTVKLLHEEEEYFGEHRCIKTTDNKKKIVAKGTIKAVEAILGQAVLFDIYDVIVSVNRQITFVNVLVNMLSSEGEDIVIGSAIVEEDLSEAIAEASLNAISRKIEKIKF